MRTLRHDLHVCLRNMCAQELDVGLWRALVGQFNGLERPLAELPPEALMQARLLVLDRATVQVVQTLVACTVLRCVCCCTMPHVCASELATSMPPPLYSIAAWRFACKERVAS